MTGSSPSSTVAKIGERLSANADRDELRRLAADLSRPDELVALSAEVNRLILVDLDRAERLADALAAPAARIDDPPTRALCDRVRANVLHRRGRYDAAMASYEAALAGFERHGHETEAAITRSSAIHNLIYLGDYRRAERWADRAQAVFEARGDDLRRARLDLNRGNIRFRQDRWEEALELYRRALEPLRRHGEPRDVAICLRDIVVCQLFVHRFDDALASYQRARDFCDRHGLSQLALENEYNIAYLHFLRGEYTRALQLYERVREACERVGDPEHVALSDLDRAEIYLELNLVEEAHELAQSAFERFDELGMRYEGAKALTLLAISISRQGREFMALELFETARGRFEAEGNPTWAAQTDLFRALVLFHEGRLVESKRLALRALAAFEKLPIATKTAHCSILLARLELAAENLGAARTHCRRALADLGEGRLPALEYQAFVVQGEIEEADGYADLALAAYREARDRLERLRDHLRTDELRITFLKDKLEVYESLVSLLFEDGADEAAKLEIFECVEKAKSRSLADLLALRSHELPPSASGRSDLVGRIRNLREELNWYYRSIDLVRMKSDAGSRHRLAELERQSQRREHDLVRALRELQSADRELSSLQEATAVGLESLRTVLPEGHLVLEYYIARDVVYALLLGREVFEVVPLTVAPRVRELQRLIQFQLSKFLLGGDYLEAHRNLVDRATATHLATLYDELIAPLEPHLLCRHLTVVPHDFMHRLPFAALLGGERYLIDRFSISHAPSAGVDFLCRGKPSRGLPGALVLGAGDPRAPYIDDEARGVAEILEGSTLLAGGEATIESLQRLGREAGILHIATHGVFRRDNPMFSAIQLADDRLSLFDLYHLELDADLVVLSGCGTGLNVVVGADELVGLSRGLLYAGARSVLVTLWDVHDRSALDFMRHFYRAYLDSRSPAQALRGAMLAMREVHAHPYFWAPFVLVGRP